MIAGPSRLAWATVAVAGLAAGGCAPCVSMARAAAMRQSLESQNRARAEPAMREAARLHGAVLLPITVQDLPLPPRCGSPDIESIRQYPEGTCLEPSADERVKRMRIPGERTRLVILLAEDASPYARLAQRGSKIVVLKPRVSQRKVGDETECECDRMPRPYIPRAFAFVIDDMESVEVEIIEVAMTEDVVDWTCKAGLA